MGLAYGAIAAKQNLTEPKSGTSKTFFARLPVFFIYSKFSLVLGNRICRFFNSTLAKLISVSSSKCCCYS